MKIKCEICYDVSGDCVLGPHSYVQVIMARSLLGNWKQPVYYNFDQKMTKEILFSVVKKFDEFGFKVIAITNDMGGGNRGLWRDLGISALNPNFRVDDMGEEIFVFPDAPHLLKLIRNHFLDKGLMYKGVLVNQNPIREMIQQTSQNELRIAYKVSEEHLTVKAAVRQKVKYAAQLFSRSVYAALIHLGSAGKLRSPNWRETAEFIKLVNDWFDLLNSSVPYRDSRERVHAYCASPVQNQILTEMKSVAINLLRRKTKLPFQNGIIMFSNALPLLYQSVRKTHNVQYILTSRLSQDVLEHFFSVVRSIGGLHDHPHALEFKYRFRRLLISSNTESMSRERNVLPDKGCSSNFITSYANSPEVIVSQETLADFAEPENTEHPEQDHEDNADPSYVEDNVLCLQEIQECGLEYIAGYVAFKRRGTEVLGYPTSQHAGVNSRWIQLLSEGGLYCPTDDFLALVYVMERIFEKHNPTDGISKSANILQTLISESTSSPCSEQTRKLFFRTRIYIRIKYLNSKIKASQTQVQGKKNKKKMVKIIT
uniref:Uncharacterized protein n=1 Tax=Phlebotomus papatasi TaxID=29031 RepID=A0A1B0D942_PHLPP